MRNLIACHPSSPNRKRIIWTNTLHVLRPLKDCGGVGWRQHKKRSRFYYHQEKKGFGMAQSYSVQAMTKNLKRAKAKAKSILLRSM